ncbi:xanthine phosphoribosyltransferase [Desulfobotulus alkaliphilus]|uniref:Xanthine phosphoribosyltransferase n=1 Tax=Desulfobotulus alkaliphilus TaxID=622671 RepID=A0A562RGN3_9BACT|nr:xanthine phosphoribosyltransferase [Desulfobotulus alkaliphilus]TWI68168.1 xanthine phosphoribosyltransferase [Desulfobotulus alkaliphilus]
MKLLEEKIVKEGRTLGDHILKVDHFLNHQLDIDLLNAIGKAFKERFKEERITKILTAEVSGIAVAAITAQHFKVPVVFAKKTESLNLDKETFEGHVYSYTKEKHYKIRVSKNYLLPDDRVLIIDDFLAKGEAIKGLWEIVESAGAYLVGAGVVIEKYFQGGGNRLREKGLNVQALASITSLKNGQITFLENQ